jgi:hypothetical protein
MPMTDQQARRLKLWHIHGQCFQTVADLEGVSRQAATQSIQAALKWENASPGQQSALEATGLDITGAKHGWRGVKHPDGSFDSVFWKAERDPEAESINLGDAIKETLKNVLPYPVIPSPKDLPKDLCNFIPLCDLHVGGEYGDPEYLKVVHGAVHKLMTNLPKAKKAVLMEMGDLLDANDHHGLTPASGNECDVIRENHLKNTLDALEIMRFACVLLAQTHEEVEVHLLRGNHDETAYIGVMVALYEHFKDNPRIDVKVNDDDFRVIPWGKCAVFPHHGDKAKWQDLKDVFSDQFPDAWSKAKYWRFIWTAHVHHGKSEQLIGAEAEHFRTLAAPNRWAMLKGLFSRGGIECVTLHKEDGEVDRKKVNLKPLLLQDRKKK